MDSLLTLFILSFIMFLTSFLCGMAPLALKVVSSSINVLFISSFGGGLLIGTVFLVILPEGTNLIYKNLQHQMNYQANHTASNINSVTMHQSQIKISSIMEKHQDIEAPYLGVVLLLGFTLMLIMDKAPFSFNRNVNHHHQHQSDIEAVHSRHNSNERVCDKFEDDSSETTEPIETLSPRSNTSSRKRMNVIHVHPSSSVVMRNTLLGLMIHCICDGIALGSASGLGTNQETTSSTTLIVIFLAILVHKGPMMFGIASLLLKNQWTMNRRGLIRRWLTILSAAAPLAAMIVAILVRLLSLLKMSQNQSEAEKEMSSREAGLWSGYLLLFSAGSFLYVATMHILPEILERQISSEIPPVSSPNNHTFSRTFENDYLHAVCEDQQISWKTRILHNPWTQFMFIIMGILVPFVLMTGVHTHS